MSALEQEAVAQLRAACLAPAAAQSELLARILAAGLEEDAPALVDGAPPPSAARATPPPEEVLAQKPLTTWADYSPTMQAALAAADAMGSDDGRCGCGCGGTTAQAEYEQQLAAFGVDAGRVLEFWLTSGTTGSPKVLPVTPEVLRDQQQVRGWVLGLHGTQVRCAAWSTPRSPPTWAGGCLSRCPHKSAPCAAPQLCLLAHHLMDSVHPKAAAGLEVRLAYAGAVRMLGNGRSVAVSTSTSWRRLAAQRDRCGRRTRGRHAVRPPCCSQAEEREAATSVPAWCLGAWLPCQQPPPACCSSHPGCPAAPAWRRCCSALPPPWRCWRQPTCRPACTCTGKREAVVWAWQ